MYCGIIDGNYAQDQHARLSERPWLVDFDLLRMHPLANNFGMGSTQMFYKMGWCPTNLSERVDRFLAATVAFGHQGFFLKNTPEWEEHSYFMVLGTARHYCMANAREIRYADAKGCLLDTSAAIASGAFRRSQVTVLYDDGTRVAANGSTNEAMSVEWKGGRLVLAPNGFCAASGDGTAWAVSGAKRGDGHRLDIAVAPDYVYLNAHGKLSVSPQGGTDGRMYRLMEKNGTEEVFLAKGTVFILPYEAKSVTALDEDGNAFGAVAFRTENGQTRLVPRKGATSYRVTK